MVSLEAEFQSTFEKIDRWRSTAIFSMQDAQTFLSKIVDKSVISD